MMGMLMRAVEQSLYIYPSGKHRSGTMDPQHIPAPFTGTPSTIRNLSESFEAGSPKTKQWHPAMVGDAVMGLSTWSSVYV